MVSKTISAPRQRDRCPKKENLGLVWTANSIRGTDLAHTLDLWLIRWRLLSERVGQPALPARSVYGELKALRVERREDRTLEIPQPLVTLRRGS